MAEQQPKKTDPDSKPSRKTSPKDDKTAAGYQLGKVGTYTLPNGLTVKTN